MFLSLAPPEQQYSQLRFSLNDEPSILQHQQQQPPPQNLPQLLADANLEPGRLSGSGSCGIPQVRHSTFNSSQFNLVSSEPYPSPRQTAQSPPKETPSSRFRGAPIREKDENDCDTRCCDSSASGGLLVVNIIAGSGLKTSQLLLRDLYCVLETDSVRKARSMIRTSTDFFEWDETFEMDVEDSRFLSILIYQWDPRTRHRLCFYGGIDLTSLIQRILSVGMGPHENDDAQERRPPPLATPVIGRAGLRFEKIALQLEPKGVLYLQLGYLPMKALFQRRILSSAAFESTAPFGVELDELMYRNRMLVSLGVLPPVDSTVPLVIRRCVEEIERRGSEVVGIYRLSGSVWMKLQVRELFMKTSERVVQGLAKRNLKAVRAANATLDLSAEVVPDIHAITGKPPCLNV